MDLRFPGMKDSAQIRDTQCHSFLKCLLWLCRNLADSHSA